MYTSPLKGVYIMYHLLVEAVQPAALLALFSVILLDLVLSGDNAIVIGTIAASLPQDQQAKAVDLGMLVAVILRIFFCLIGAYLLMIPGVKVIGGLLLLWVAWGMYKDMKDDGELDDSASGDTKKKTFIGAIWAITLADMSMSIDNVLAVAGTAHDHVVALVIGLLFSVGALLIASKIVVKVINKFTWLAWVGMGIIVLVGGKMIYHGIPELIADYHKFVA